MKNIMKLNFCKLLFSGGYPAYESCRFYGSDAPHH